MLLHAKDVLRMNTFRISTLSAIALVVGMLACHSVAAPQSARASKGTAALVDEGGSNAPATKDNGSASETAATQSKTACDNSAAQKDESKVPVFPIVISAIGTIAFIVLAIIF